MTMLVAAPAGRITPKYSYFAFLFSTTFIFGFLIGVYVFSQNASTYASLVRATTASPALPIGTLIRVTWGFVLTAAFYRCRSWCYLLLSFIEVAIFGIASAAIWSCFGSAQWLLQSFLLFARIVSLTMLHWFWLRNISRQGSAALRDFLIALAISTLAMATDIFMLSPYICDLFEIS